MEDKRYLPFKIAHLILMSLTIIVTLVGMIQMARKFGTGIDGVLVIRLISSVVRIAGMIIGIIYLVSGYKKSAASYYKLFFCLMTIALFFRQMVFVIRQAPVIALHLPSGRLFVFVIDIPVFHHETFSKSEAGCLQIGQMKSAGSSSPTYS